MDVRINLAAQPRVKLASRAATPPEVIRDSVAINIISVIARRSRGGIDTFIVSLFQRHN